ncbi:hypothetical protein HYX03_03340 [Candidatus Woesearchaeota archaeon]|nr:hypothetical protein [Candidatus Woesearchaeota archaeon]
MGDLLEGIIKSITRSGNRVEFQFKRDAIMSEVSGMVSNLLSQYFSEFSDTPYYPNFGTIELKRGRGDYDYVVKGYDPDNKVLSKNISEEDGIALGFIKVRASGDKLLSRIVTIQMRTKESLGQRFCIDYPLSKEVAQKFMVYAAIHSGPHKHSQYPLPTQHR